MDTVNSWVSFILPSNVEKLTLQGPASLNGTGNNVANVLTGNAGANFLNGREGNDTLAGGSGKDTFVFNTPLDKWANVDTITGFPWPMIRSSSKMQFSPN